MCTLDYRGPNELVEAGYAVWLQKPIKLKLKIKIQHFKRNDSTFSKKIDQCLKIAYSTFF